MTFAELTGVLQIITILLAVAFGCLLGFLLGFLRGAHLGTAKNSALVAATAS